MRIIDGGSEILTQNLVDVERLGFDSDVFLQIDLVSDESLQARFRSFQLRLKGLSN